MVKLVQYPGSSVGGAPDSRSWRVVLNLNSSLVGCMFSLPVTPGLKIILKLRIVQCSLDLVKKILFLKKKKYMVWTYFIDTIKWSESQVYRNEQWNYNIAIPMKVVKLKHKRKILLCRIKWTFHKGEIFLRSYFFMFCISICCTQQSINGFHKDLLTRPIHI